METWSVSATCLFHSFRKSISRELSFWRGPQAGCKVTKAHKPLGVKGSTWRLVNRFPGNQTKVRLGLGLAAGKGLSVSYRGIQRVDFSSEGGGDQV